MAGAMMVEECKAAFLNKLNLKKKKRPDLRSAARNNNNSSSSQCHHHHHLNHDHDHDHIRNYNHNQKSSSILEAISQGGKVTSYSADVEEGTVRMKILVKKQDLKQILAAAAAAATTATTTTSSSVSRTERRLLDLMRRRGRGRGPHCSGQANKRNISSSSSSAASTWRPALHSIPEEHY